MYKLVVGNEDYLGYITDENPNTVYPLNIISQYYGIMPSAQYVNSFKSLRIATLKDLDRFRLEPTQFLNTTKFIFDRNN